MRVFLLSVTLFFAALAGTVQAAEWVVERATRNVQVSADGKAWRRVDAGSAIPNAAWVRTGPRDRVILAKGSELYHFDGNALLETGGETAVKTELDELGYFDLGQVEDGAYLLKIEFEETSIHIADVQVP